MKETRQGRRGVFQTQVMTVLTRLGKEMLHVVENPVKCCNKYIRIIYNWHTLCLNANTAVKVVLKNSLLAFSAHRRNISLVYTTPLLSKPLFIL